MIDPFDTLGLAASFDVDVPAVERRVRELSRVLHPDRHLASTAAERRMALGKAVEVNEAFRIVRDPIRRAEALLRRAGVVVAEGAEPRPDPAFLMDVMERREALAEARSAKDAPKLERLAGEVRAMQERALAKLRAGFAAGGDVGALVPVVGELRYYRRFLDEVGTIEEELAEGARP
jgi:molecular chaperone HscB